MASKEKKGFKQISKKFLSSFRKEKKLHDITEIQEDHTGRLSLNDTLPGSSSTRNKNEHNQHHTLTLSPNKSGKNHFKRILNRASFSNVRSIAKEHPDLLRNINSTRAGQYDLGGSRSASTDSGIDCSILVSEKGSPEKFVAFTRREAERLRQDFVNESILETVTEVDSKSSFEEEEDGSAEVNTDNEANESLEDQINHTKEQIEVLTELKTVLSGKLKEFDQVKSESPVLDEENYVVMTPPTSNSSRTRIQQEEFGSRDGDLNESHVYFLSMYSNKTDEIKAEETRKRLENNSSIYDRPAPDGEIDHMIMEPIPVLSASVSSHKTLPSTPAQAYLLNNENSAFAKCKTVKRSVSDVSKGLFGKFRSKKKENQSGNFMSKDDCITVESRKNHNKMKTKSLKKNNSFSFDGEHDVSLDYLNCTDVNFKLLDDHTSIVEDIDSIQPIVGSGDSDRKRKSPVIKEILHTNRRPSPLSGSITEMTNGICEMTSALCDSQRNSVESIACICDCKNRNSNNEICCEKRRTPTLIEHNDVFKTVTMSKPLIRNEQHVNIKTNSKIDQNQRSSNQGKAQGNIKENTSELLNKSIKDIDVAATEAECLYVNLAEGQINHPDKPIGHELNDSYSDSEGCDCCDCCSQGCDCSHSETECSDPNCAECIAELNGRRKYGNISSSCDSLSENDGFHQLDQSIRKPYPNWVHSSDDQTSGSSTRSSPNDQLSVTNKSMVEDHSPEPVRITKYDSSPNSMNSFNMDTSFSVSFREVNFENGEVMYALDNSVNDSLISEEQQASSAIKKMPPRGKQHPYSSPTPAPSPSVSVSHGFHPNMNSTCVPGTSDRVLRNSERKRVSDHMNFSLPMNLSFSQNQGIDHVSEDPYVTIGVSDSPLNLKRSDKYEKTIEEHRSMHSTYSENVTNKIQRNGKMERPGLTRGQLSRSSLLSRSLNESQILQNDEQLRNRRYNDRQKFANLNKSLNESFLLGQERNDGDRRSAMRQREQRAYRASSMTGRLSKSFSGGVNLNSTILNDSCAMDPSMLGLSNSPLDLSISRPRNNRDWRSPKPLDLSMSRVASPLNRMNKQAKWVDRHVGQIYSPAKRVLHKNQGMSESDLCKQILDLYVSDAEESVYEQHSMLDSTMNCSVTGDGGDFNAEDSMLQYGTYLAPRHVVKETNVDDFTTTVRTCYTGEAKTRKLPADCYDTCQEIPSRDKFDKPRKEKIRSGGRKPNRDTDLNSSRMKENMHQTKSLLNRSVEHIYEEIPSFSSKRSVLKDKTNTLKNRSSLKLTSSRRSVGEEMEKEPMLKKDGKEVKELSDKSFDQLTMLHTAHNGQRKVKCLSMDESIHVVKHYPPPKEASRISWGQNLSEMDLWRHTPKKSPVKTTPILAQKENAYPYEDDTPSPIVLTKIRKPKSFVQKYKNWPWS